MTDTTTTETEDVSGLKSNNADLKSRLDKANKANRDLESRLEALENSHKDALDEALDASKSEAERALAKAQRTIDKLTADLSAANNDLSTLKIDNVIGEAITKNGVMPHHADILSTFLRNGAKMENGEATVNGIPLSDHLSTFFSSDAAKHYIAAPANSGAGAMGSTNTAATGPIKDVNAFMKLAKENPEAAKAANVDPSIAYLKDVL